MNLKSLTKCCEILVFVERFFHHVVDAYAERKEHRSRSELLSRHLSDGDYELDLAIFVTYHTIPNVNESNNKFYFAKDDTEITTKTTFQKFICISYFIGTLIPRVRTRYK